MVPTRRSQSQRPSLAPCAASAYRSSLSRTASPAWRRALTSISVPITPGSPSTSVPEPCVSSSIAVPSLRRPRNW